MAVITTTYYTLNDCCTNQPINWPPNEGGLQGTLYLEFNGIFCNAGDFNNTPCPNDLTNLIITEIVNEAQVNITGCLKLTSVSITEIPVGADILEWENIMSAVSTVPTCEDCQTCSLPVYYTLNDCCSNQPYKVEGDIVYIEYTNECEPGVCPTNLENLVITEILNETGLPATGCFNLTEVTLPALANTIYPWELFVQEVSTVQTCAECQECCYTLTNCETEEVIYSNSNTLIQHFGNTVTLNGQEGCWEVGISAGICDCLTVTITTDQTSENYTANAIGAYNGYNLYEFTLDGDIVYIWSIGVAWAISANGYGEDPVAFEIAVVKFEGDCPDSVNEGFTWDLSEVTFNSIETEVCPAECTCPIPVTVLQSFEGCPSCLPIVAYKFTNCNNQTLVQYSTEDYSAYVGKTVELECGDCWFVSQINYTPPSIQTITILYTFDSCIICNRTYYKLVDCLNPTVNIVYTYSDLSDYLGMTIKIKGCDSCFTVLEETREPVNPGIVEVTETFETCPECVSTPPCLCTRRTNYSTTVKEYQYIDCNGDESVVITLQPNESTGKLCVGEWRVFYPETDNLEIFGECDQVSNLCYEYDITIGTNTTAILYYKNCTGTVESQQTLSQKSPYTITICGVNNQTSSDIYIVGSGSMQFEKTTVCDLPLFVCPITTPKRKVKPGYSTPSCDIEKYEKITCKSSEIYYKQVMRRRYGISNCCPEEEEKWLIKKELIDLDALRDPDYICTPVTSCCGQTIETCGCGCNQTLKTCNS